jgi:hypothetical protein
MTGHWTEKKSLIESAFATRLRIVDGKGALPGIAILHDGELHPVEIAGKTESIIVSDMFTTLHQARGRRGGVVVRLDENGQQMAAFVYDQARKTFRELNWKNSRDRSSLLLQAEFTLRATPQQTSLPLPRSASTQEKAWHLLYELADKRRPTP